MKVEYREVKTWKCNNPDGSTVVIAEGDRVKITYDTSKNAFSDDFNRRYPEDTVIVDVQQLFKNKIFGVEVDASKGVYVELKTHQIISVEKLYVIDGCTK